MLTDYLVHCPHTGCNWKGCLFPEGGREAWRPAAPTQNKIAFRCPSCKQQWHARIVGEDAIPLTAAEEAAVSV
jgi:hypothetical protein